MSDFPYVHYLYAGAGYDVVGYGLPTRPASVIAV